MLKWFIHPLILDGGSSSRVSYPRWTFPPCDLDQGAKRAAEYLLLEPAGRATGGPVAAVAIHSLRNGTKTETRYFWEECYALLPYHLLFGHSQYLSRIWMVEVGAVSRQQLRPLCLVADPSVVLKSPKPPAWQLIQQGIDYSMYVIYLSTYLSE